jgi:pimeloyl-ACP methyl ester carboxylesterase
MIPFFEIGGSEPVAHFAHANGYPPECYRPLLERLSANFHVLAMHQRSLWPGSKPGEIEDWLPFSHDLMQFLDEQKLDSIIAIGHSLGGIASLRAAMQNPHRFRALILLDPVLFPPYMTPTWQLIRAFKLEYRLNPFIRNTLRRRQTFESREKLYDLYRRKQVFRYFSDESLKALIAGLTRPQNGKFELVQSPEWEARIYVTAIWRDMDIWRGLAYLKVPLLIIRGAETDTFREQTGRLVRKRLPSAQVVTLERATHLVPLEQPDEVSRSIFNFLEECL